MKRFIGFLRLMRPANIITAIADVLAGIVIAGYITDIDSLQYVRWEPVFCLVLSTIGLYGGGVVFNDVFDADLDAVERPERPIPSGLVPKQQAAWWATVLLLIGVLSASMLAYFHGTWLPGILAFAIAIAALVYDKWSKHHDWAGPLNMGLCRGLNLLLGMSIIHNAVLQYWWIAIVPVIYIAAITMISRGEVHGGRRYVLHAAAGLYALVIGCILLWAIYNDQWPVTLVFLLLFALMICLPLQKAIRDPAGKNIGKAVKAGVIGLILMNAAWVAAFGSVYFACAMLLLLPVSVKLARMFAVT